MHYDTPPCGRWSLVIQTWLPPGSVLILFLDKYGNVMYYIRQVARIFTFFSEVFMRVQVNLSDDMVERVDKLAKSYGVSRSALMALYIGQVVDGTEKAIKTLGNPEVVNHLTDEITK